MIFRSTRRIRSSSASNLGVGATSSGATTPHSSSVGATQGSTSNFNHMRSRLDRPNSAPSAAISSPSDTTNVEQRLKIVKRNRASKRTQGNADEYEENRMGSPVPLPPSMSPPCAAYPTFNLERRSKHEQHVLDAMIGETLDVLLFPGVI